MSKFYLDWKQRAIKDGKGFHVDVGAFSTPILGGGAGTIFDQDQPEGVISVPANTSIMPIRISVQCQTPLLATDADESEILIAADIAAVPASFGTATAETPTNMHSLHGATSLCTCKSACTANMTSPTLGVELLHSVVTGDIQGTAANALWGQLECLYEPVSPSIFDGPCALYLYWGGTVATNGFAQIEWLEFQSSDVA